MAPDPRVRTRSCLSRLRSRRPRPWSRSPPGLSQDLSIALGMVDRIEAALERSGIRCPRLLHGTEATAWPLLDEAACRGYDARIGLEDTLRLPDGTPADGNGALVVEARRRLLMIGLNPRP
jgi:uncharacterized protein (DUF849 family)